DSKANCDARCRCAAMRVRDRQEVPRQGQGSRQVTGMPVGDTQRQRQMQPGYRRCGISMMRSGNIIDICLLAGALIVFAAPAPPAHAQAGVTADDMLNRLTGAETAPDLNVAAIRQRALDRVKSK